MAASASGARSTSPEGGPDGGDGGRGGDVVVRDRHGPQHPDRLPLPPAFQAERGQHGMGKDRTGAQRRRPLLVEVPIGTQILRRRRQTLLVDLVEPGEQRGRSPTAATAASATSASSPSPNRAPRRADPGRAGRGALGLAAPQAAGRRRPGRPAQRRQVDLPGRGLARAAEDRRLSRSPPSSPTARHRDRRPRRASCWPTSPG